MVVMRDRVRGPINTSLAAFNPRAALGPRHDWAASRLSPQDSPGATWPLKRFDYAQHLQRGYGGDRGSERLMRRYRRP
jgi:hypothetical protein